MKFSSLCSLLLLKLKHLSGLLLLKVHMLTQVSEGGFNGLNWENTRSLLHFLIFLLENIKNAFVLSDVFWIPPTFSPLTPLQSLRVATSSATGCYVLREATPKGDPGLAPDSAALRFRLRDPSLVTFRSFRKVVRDPKKFSRTSIFSVLSKEKKFQRTFSILRLLQMFVRRK